MNVVDIRFATYNVLTPALATPNEHRRCRPSDLRDKVRFNRMTKKLQKEVDLSAIIALQEVSHDWSARFKAFFEKNDYFYHGECYNIPVKGTRGIALAFPNQLYTVQELVRFSLIKISHVVLFVDCELCSGCPTNIRNSCMALARNS